MTVPTVPTFSAAALIAANTTFKVLLDAGAGAAFVRVRNSADLLLAQIPLNDPCGTVSGTTGQITFSIAGPDTAADASGTAAYAEFCDSTGLVHLALPVQVGTSAVPGKAALNTLTIVAGSPVTLIAATLG